MCVIDEINFLAFEHLEVNLVRQRSFNFTKNFLRNAAFAVTAGQLGNGQPRD